MPQGSAVALRGAGLFDFEGRVYSSAALRGELRGPIEFAVVELPFLAAVHDSGWTGSGLGSALGAVGFHWRSRGIGFAVGAEVRVATSPRVDAPAFWVLHRRESTGVSTAALFADVELSEDWGAALRLALGAPVGGEYDFWSSPPYGTYIAASWVVPLRPWLGVVSEAEVAFDDPPFSLRGALRARLRDQLHADLGLQFPVVLLIRQPVLIPFAQLRAQF
ncbi:MAG: hypothetical protein FJ102_14035 [Deltaproteobacteria bacterium]|nr:hypothetical protein [Deltaproteobacteria bacterium]